MMRTTTTTKRWSLMIRMRKGRLGRWMIDRR
jgi:hypothetical protein